MSWRTVAAVMIVLFTALAMWATLADPMVQIGNSFQDVADGETYDIDGRIDGLISHWFDMFLILTFGVMAWGGWRVLRKELTRDQL